MPSATRSARPAARIVLIWSADVMLPTAHGRHAPPRCGCESENERLEHAAIDRPALRRGLAGRDVDEIDASLVRRPARWRWNPRSVSAAFGPVGGRDAHRHRLLRRPGRAHGLERPLSGKRRRLSMRAAIVVGAACWSAATGRRRADSRGRSEVPACRSRSVTARSVAATNWAVIAVHAGLVEFAPAPGCRGSRAGR